MTLQATKRIRAGPDVQRAVLARQRARQHAAADAAHRAGRDRTAPTRATSIAISGPNPLDMRHNFNGNVVYMSQSHSSNAVVRAAAERQPDRRAAAVQQRPAGEHPGEPRPERRRRQQRPAAVRRAATRCICRPEERRPPLHALDSRSRGSVRAEVIAEMKNVFNIRAAAASRPTIATGRRARQSTGRRFPTIRTSSRILRARRSSSGSSSWDSSAVLEG